MKQVIISEFMEVFLKFSIAFFLSWVGLKLLLEFQISRYYITSNLKSQMDIVVGLSIIYVVYFAHVFYQKIDSYIFDEINKLIKSVNENSYTVNYKTYEFMKISNVLNKKTNEIIKKDQDLVKGISYISHDVKTPITIINTNIDLIKNSKEHISNENLARMERIYSETNKISIYIDKIMNIAKTQLEENEVIQISLYDFVESVEKNILIYSDMLEEEIEIIKHIENYNQVIYANKKIINECIIHLLNNAYEHKKDKIKVEIKANSRLEISVIDDGCGFEDNILKTGKDLFITSNTGRTSGKGYGIGLYYVNTYLNKISGKLDLINVSQGAIAKITIPMEALDD